MCTAREQIEDAIDAARGSDLRPLESIVMGIALQRCPGLRPPDLNEIRNEVLLALAGLFHKHQTTPIIGNQLRRIVQNKVVDFLRSQIRHRDHSIVGDDGALLDDHPGTADVEAVIVDREACDRIYAALDELKRVNPRYHVAIMASVQGESVSERLTGFSGTTVTVNTARKVLERARTAFAKLHDSSMEKAS